MLHVGLWIAHLYTEEDNSSSIGIAKFISIVPYTLVKLEAFQYNTISIHK